MMKRIFLGAVFIAAFGSAPALSELQLAAQIGPDSFFCADNTSCDLNPAIGTIQVANQTIDGIEVNGSIQASVHSASPSLNTSSLSLVNTSGAPVVATVAVGDTDYMATLIRAIASGAGTWQGPGGSSVSLSWFIDPANAQGADTAFDTPGGLLDTFSATAAPITDSFSHNSPLTLFDLTSPFSMTEQATIVLAPGEELLNRGQALVGLAVPEPSTWVMLALGFLALGGVAFGKRQRFEF